MPDTSQSLTTLLFDGNGGAETVPFSPEAARGGQAPFTWTHLNWEDEESYDCLTEHLAVDPVIADALLMPETRPRSLPVGRDAMIILRGVNLSPGAAPEDMVSLRVLIGPDRVFTLARRELRSIADLRRWLHDGEGPARAGDFIASLVEAMIDRIVPVVLQLSDQVDELEDDVIDGLIGRIEGQLAAIRRRVIQLRRFMAPQRDALLRLAGEKFEWLQDADRARLREAAEKLTRLVDDLETFRDRGQVMQEEIAIRVNRQLNRNAYILTVGGGILLPLNLIAGMLGMNVGGIPGKDWPWAFAFIAGLFVLFGLGAFVLGRRRRWF